MLMQQIGMWALCGAAFALCGMAAARGAGAAETTPVRAIQTAQADTARGFYTPNRAPLQPTAFMKLPVGSITAQGWLRHQLELDASGLVGGLPEISNFLKFEGNGWVDPKGKDGWEELPYWLRGYGDLGYALKDAKILKESRRWIDGILAAQRPDGYFGPERLKTSEGGLPDLWPHMLVLAALRSYYEYSADARVLKFMTAYFRWQTNLPVEAYRKGWGAVRWADNMA